MDDQSQPRTYKRQRMVCQKLIDVSNLPQAGSFRYIIPVYARRPRPEDQRPITMAFPTSATSYNYSLQAIPICFGLAFVPHTFYLVDLWRVTQGKISTAMPRTDLDTWRSKLPTDVWNRLARTRGAHLNALEVFPLFAAAVVSASSELLLRKSTNSFQLAGNMAQLPTSDLNSMAWTFLGARVAFTAMYMGIKSNTLAYARTGVYFWGLSIPVLTLWRAGQAASDV